MYFAKHETFHIRDGWLSKGLHALQENPRIFLDAEAPQKLGLGKNMVRALRFWMQATGLTVEVFAGGHKVQQPTLFGKLIADSDPYLEREGSLWLIHHHLLSSRQLAATWYWFFNHYLPPRFTRTDFLERLTAWVTIQPDSRRKVAQSSLKKDFSALIKTYLADQDARQSPEDILECPLAGLGLLSAFTERGDDERRRQVYRYESGPAAAIHPLVFLYVLLHRQRIERSDATQVGLPAVLREPMNAGRTFNLGRRGLEDLLARLNDGFAWQVALTRTGGLDQLTLPDVAADAVLRAFYAQSDATSEEMRPCWVLPLP